MPKVVGLSKGKNDVVMLPDQMVMIFTALFIRDGFIAILMLRHGERN